MELRDLIGALEAPMLMGADNVDITNIQSDSRRVTKGSLFVAVRRLRPIWRGDARLSW